MGIGITNAGGGTSLNFTIKAYPTEEALMASTPKANTIGIITENKITSWEFSAIEPSAPAEGMVWISVGTNSAVEFNALKKNAVQVYPISAKQYVDGAWVSVTAMSYQGGEWKNWILSIFKDGSLMDGCSLQICSGTSSAKIEILGTDISYTSSSIAQGGGFYIDPTFDVTNFKTLYVDMTITLSGSSLWSVFGLASDPSWTDGGSHIDANTRVNGSVGRTMYAIDISSLTGNKYFVYNAYATGSADVKIHELRIE